MKMKQEHFDQLKNAIEAFIESAPKTLAETVEAYETGNFARSDRVKDLQTRFCFDAYYAARMPREWSDAISTSGCNSDHIFTALKRILPKVVRKY